MSGIRRRPELNGAQGEVQLDEDPSSFRFVNVDSSPRGIEDFPPRIKENHMRYLVNPSLFQHLNLKCTSYIHHISVTALRFEIPTSPDGALAAPPWTGGQYLSG